ncbi:MAG: hypothetical protein U9R75_02050 [Candidatus Thermoplasmatota archaeon]|nr:hypothetical protein [Candidatus Thermoplasmatota archaeon]
MMKIIVENIIASCKVKGDLHLDRIADSLKGAKYQPSLFEGVIYTSEEPKSDIFIHKDGTVKLHGSTSEEKVKNALNMVLDKLKEDGIDLEVSEPLKVLEIIASFSIEGKLDPKEVYEEFKEDGVIYDPSELPGFILHIGKSGIEVLIFPEGKVISKGADNLQDAISSLQMVDSRIRAGE